MKQVLIIHGGDSYLSHDAYLKALKASQIEYERLIKTPGWRDWIASELTETDVLMPDFPNKQNAQYEEWKIYFEKLIPFFSDDISLIGYSLGAMFLAKYLNESPLHEKVRRIVLVSPSHSDDTVEGVGSFCVTSAKNLVESSDDIHLFHSKDDPICPFTEFEKFLDELPEATAHIFEDRGHFFQPTFPELLEVLNQK